MRTKSWITLSGLEFGLHDGSRVCWPWRDVEVAKDAGFVPQSDGKPFKPGGVPVVLRCADLPRNLGRRLKARSLRTSLQAGCELSYECKNDATGGAVVIGIFTLVCLVAAAIDRRNVVLWLIMAAMCATFAAWFFRMATAQTVRTLTVSATGARATLKDGRVESLLWQDLDRSGTRWDTLISLNGVTLCFKPSPDLYMGLVAARARRGRSARGTIRMVERAVRCCVLSGVGAGGVGYVIWRSFGLQPVTGVPPTWVLMRMILGSIGLALLLLVRFWGEYYFWRWVCPMGIKVTSVAPPPEIARSELIDP